MRLGLKLIALGIVLLLPKTNLYLSYADTSEPQTVSERQISSPADANSAGYLTVSAVETQ